MIIKDHLANNMDHLTGDNNTEPKASYSNRMTAEGGAKDRGNTVHVESGDATKNPKAYDAETLMLQMHNLFFMLDIYLESNLLFHRHFSKHHAGYIVCIV